MTSKNLLLVTHHSSLALPLFLTGVFTGWQDESCPWFEAYFYVQPVGGVRFRSHRPKWRNWQTRYIQGVVPVRAWRFESSLRHQLKRSPITLLWPFPLGLRKNAGQAHSGTLETRQRAFKKHEVTCEEAEGVFTQRQFIPLGSRSNRLVQGPDLLCLEKQLAGNFYFCFLRYVMKKLV